MSDGYDGIDPLPTEDAASAAAGVSQAATPRAMKQPRKDVLRDALREAADAIQELKARVLWWESHHEQAVNAALDERGPLPGLALLAIGAIVGVVCMAVAGWAL